MTIAIATLTRRFMYRCHKCKHVWAREYRTFTGGINKDRLYRIQEDVPGCRIPVLQAHDYKCPACGSIRTESGMVKGRASEHKCDPRCTSARGHDCECSCGGKNHGIDHLI